MDSTYEYSNWVLIGVVIYLAAMLYIGYLASKRIESNTDFLVAGRRLGLFFCTGTLFATWFGSGTCMGGAGNAYLFGNQGVIFDPWGAAVCLIIAGFFFARIMRRGRFLTLADIFDIRYGRGMGMISTATISVAEIGWVGAQLVGFGTILHFFAGIPLWVGIVVATLILIVYTYLGGMWAVTLTDVVQMVIIVIGLVIMFFYMLPHAGGLEGLFTNDTHNVLGINRWSFMPTPEAAASPEMENAGFFYYTGLKGWLYWFGAISAIGLGSIPAQDLMQRMLSAKSEKVASYSSYWAALLYITVGMLPVMIGMIYFHINPDLGLEDAMNKILIFTAVDYLPPILTVIFVSALVSALMSSSDSAILATASVIGYNGSKYVKKDISEAQSLKITRLFVPIVTCAALVLAMYFQTIYNLMVIAWSILLVGLFAPYAAAFFWKKANQIGAISSFFAGFTAWIASYFYFLPDTMAANVDVAPGISGLHFDWAMWDALYIASPLGLLASIVTLIVVSLATQKTDVPKPLRDITGDILPTINWRGIFTRGHEDHTGHLTADELMHDER
ncbi:MAG: hypothetical protein AUK47_29100 [Deltaproteobacteria bacterium CG2_30_63_29]|nr:MAG: hypothetical protein AUK47_29100 [Deltaproteobacteria bacterium CG2_30_63_29]